jgi:hypothetical protein
MAEARDEHAAKNGLTDTKLAGIEVTTQYIDLIPDEYGLGVIKGTLGLIFEVGDSYAFPLMSDTDIAQVCQTWH